MKKTSVLTHDRLCEVLSYDPETGQFRWRKRLSPRREIGDVAGSPQSNGYTKIRIDRVTHLAHRLAFLHMTGRWPISGLDHIDGVRNNNRWSNLREANVSENQQNLKRARRDTKYGLLGVPYHNGFSYIARIWLNGKSRHIGSYPTAAAAHRAYLQAKRRLHKFNTL